MRDLRGWLGRTRRTRTVVGGGTEEEEQEEEGPLQTDHVDVANLMFKSLIN